MPYCRKCGKKIETEDTLCDDCRNAELIFGEAASPGRPADAGSRMDGFPKALISAILGGTALVVMLIFLMMSAEYRVIGGGWTDEAIALFVLGIIFAVGGIIVAVIFGVKSIAKFVDSKRRGKVRPIATLVCGIGGCVASAATTVYLLVAVLVLALL